MWATFFFLISINTVSADSPFFVPYKATVQNVATGDVLNLRAEPRGTSDDLGDLNNGDILEITALSVNQNWARILHGEADAWVSTKYVTSRSTKPNFEFNCGGTEPFWSVEINGRASGMIRSLGEEDVGFDVSTLTHSETDKSWYLFLFGPSFSGRVRAQSCSDGMSDRTYGWVYSGRVGDRQLNGCCTLR